MKKRCSFTIDEEMYDDLKCYAKHNGLKLNKYIIYSLNLMLIEEHKKVYLAVGTGGLSLSEKQND